MWYLSSNNEFKWTTDPELVTLESMFQELQLWKGENPMNYEAGIDYMGVFENRVFLKSSIESIISKYTNSFESIEVGDLETNANSEITAAPIKIVTKSGSELIRKVQIGL